MESRGVACKFHDDRFINPGLSHVSYKTMSEIVGDKPILDSSTIRIFAPYRLVLPIPSIVPL